MVKAGVVASLIMNIRSNNTTLHLAALRDLLSVFILYGELTDIPVVYVVLCI